MSDVYGPGSRLRLLQGNSPVPVLGRGRVQLHQCGEPLRLHGGEDNCVSMPFKEKAWSIGENVTKSHRGPWCCMG